ncbi:MAG: cytoplasmic protein, partial [Proteobacteria bacterium]|nr:cytoplasmic protein [Pseudomonadota bacterium]
CLWYEEVFRNIADQYNISQIEQLWEAIVSHRLIMTFKVDGFSVPKLEERLTDLIEQKIFLPQVILIDGLPFDKDIKKSLTELKKLAESRSLHVWFTVRTHRHDEPGPDGMPAPLLNVADLFDIIIQLQPEGKEIHVKALKGGPVACDYPELLLDPSTMLVKG